MSVRPATSVRPSARRTAATMAGLLLLSAAAAGCTDSADADGAGVLPTHPSESPSPQPSATISSNLPAGNKTIPVDKKVRFRAKDGTFDDVQVTWGKHRTLHGRLTKDKTAWVSKQRLEPGVKYDVHAVAVDDKGLKTEQSSAFSTDDLSLDQQTFPSFVPVEGQTVGVGMPVIIKFDVPVTDKASIERHLSVESSPHQVGSWHWISDQEVHWRPEHYWKAGTDVTVHANINSVPAGNGIYGQLNRTETFHIGDSVIDRIYIKQHIMKVFVNGKMVRKVTVTAGKPGFVTRSGTKVIIEKTPKLRMNSTSIGIKKGDPNYYNLMVYWDMRVTYSGEFLHAAPWSESSQGLANVSHGCVGMSTQNAKWLYHLTKVGDVVEVSGSDRHMTLTNGYGDWTEPFSVYKQGSALD